MKINPRFLRSHRFLSLLPSSTLRRLASGEGLREFPKGSVVFSQNDPCKGMYLIVSGRCESRHVDPTGHLITAIHGPGETLGDREVMHHEPYLSTVTVVTRSVLLRIPAEEMDDVFENEPKVAGKLTQSIVRRIMERRQPVAGKRIVALHALAARSHEQVLARRLADALGEITHRTVLRVHFSPAPAPLALGDWADMAPTLNGIFHFSRQVREINPRCFEMDVQVGADPGEAAFVAPFLSHLGSHFDYVLVDAGKDLPQPVLLECLVQADLTYILMRPENGSLYQMKVLMGNLGARPGGTYRHINAVICADTFQQASRFAQDCEKAGCAVHSMLHGFPLSGAPGGSAAFDAQVRRMAREIGRCRVGLALSSGGARGLAHIGVIQVLEENGIEIDAVAGASMGAYVGAVWAYGHDGVACEKIARALEHRWGLICLMDPVIPPRQGFFRTRRVIHRLHRAIGHAKFMEMVRPLRIVATDLETLDRVTFSRGEVADAVEASIAIPGICVPVLRDGHLLIDGGIADPLPVDVLSDMGIERIVAVNTIPTPAHLSMCMELQNGSAAARKHGGLRHWLNTYLNYFARGNVGDILMRANFGGQMRVAEQSGHIADVVLRPWVCDARWHDFTNPGKYIALGRKVALEQLAEIKALTQPYEKPTAALALAG
ncbi:MAG TPA: patatin-like phospholipase family protein [Chthoniobacteraceae bacterium]|jgi:NTE family protein|nr:patatin-like phospholipase family protein [Chthoniobacteraceae bacterium]